MRWLAIALVGCWADAPPTPPANVAHVPLAPVEHTVWVGHYTCEDVDRLVQLTIETFADGRARAELAFAGAEMPTGSYRMRGVVHPDPSGAFEIDLAPDRWIDKPDDYVMVGLTAVSDETRTRLVGRITARGCGKIEMSRSE